MDETKASSAAMIPFSIAETEDKQHNNDVNTGSVENDNDTPMIQEIVEEQQQHEDEPPQQQQQQQQQDPSDWPEAGWNCSIS